MSEGDMKDGGRIAAAASSLGGASRQVSLANNRLDSRELFGGTREIIIAHGDETYRLRLTAQNKLILTK
ncbi:MAG: hemin uptake protein HemP [Pseudolabrys sp.]|jgi:hemin uptake protein HemP|nr:hemin uptake protein HemP [Pseudolabrys sp.]